MAEVFNVRDAWHGATPLRYVASVSLHMPRRSGKAVAMAQNVTKRLGPVYVAGDLSGLTPAPAARVAVGDLSPWIGLGYRKAVAGDEVFRRMAPNAPRPEVGFYWYDLPARRVLVVGIGRRNGMASPPGPLAQGGEWWSSGQPYPNYGAPAFEIVFWDMDWQDTARVVPDGSGRIVMPMSDEEMTPEGGSEDYISGGFGLG